jgi:2-succinyl-5-enolpyruvyl-6-hydroxy-3-cyclohexene-1-carboxylate synthase
MLVGAPTIICNRGASGIDGIVHSAIGVALGSPGALAHYCVSTRCIRATTVQPS